MDHLVDKLTQEMAKFGKIAVAKKTNQLAFKNHSLFAHITIHTDDLDLEFITPSIIKHTRLNKVKKIKTDKFRHTVLIKSDSDIDPQVLGWLRIAHATN